jgi:hypothetical protein
MAEQSLPLGIRPFPTTWFGVLRRHERARITIAQPHRQSKMAACDRLWYYSEY